MAAGLLERLRDWLWPAAPASSPPPAAALRGGSRIYAIGDIHGEAGLLDRMAREIAADLARHPPARDALAVFLGDYIDRGPDSCAVVARLAARDFPLPFETLRGNHEDLMLRALEEAGAMADWCHTGGIETLRSYGLDVDKAKGPKALGRLRLALLDVLPPGHRTFLEATRLSITRGDYCFVHAGARPGVPLDRQDPRDLMWIRDECYGSSHDFGKVLVHGHTPRKRPENLPRRINIDTGAFKWGVLTAVVLDGDARRFVSAGH